MFLDYIIWANDENINRIKKSENILIDVPTFYILLNGKKEIFYDYIFQCVYNIITKK